jgi:hypothetical protein
MGIWPVARSTLAFDVGLKTPSVERIFERNDSVLVNEVYAAVDLTSVVQKTPSGCNASCQSSAESSPKRTPLGQVFVTIWIS